MGRNGVSTPGGEVTGLLNGGSRFDARLSHHSKDTNTRDHLLKNGTARADPKKNVTVAGLCTGSWLAPPLTAFARISSPCPFAYCVSTSTPHRHVQTLTSTFLPINLILPATTSQSLPASPSTYSLV